MNRYAAAVGLDLSALVPQFAPATATTLEHADGRFSPIIIDTQGNIIAESDRRYLNRALAEADAMYERKRMLANRARMERDPDAEAFWAAFCGGVR